MVACLVIFTLIVPVIGVVQGANGVSVTVKIEKPFNLSAALGVNVGSKSNVPEVTIVAGELALQAILATELKFVTLTCPGCTL